MGTIRIPPLDRTETARAAIGHLYEPDLRTHLFFRGDGDTSYECGRCHETIIKGVERGEPTGMGFVCPGCNADLYITDALLTIEE